KNEMTRKKKSIVLPPRAAPAPHRSSVPSPSLSTNNLLIISQTEPVLEKDASNSIEGSVSDLDTPTKNFLDSNRSPKKVEKEKKSMKGGQPKPSSSRGRKKEIPETPKISSNIEMIAQSPKHKWNVDRRKWEARRQSLIDRGIDLDVIRTGRADLQMWDGVSHLPVSKRKDTFYVVWNGRRKGVFKTWPKTQDSIAGFPRAGFKKVMGTEREALQLLEEKLMSDSEESV
ncbi:MAG: RNase H1/viroplasmin domain-containing protein, partial [Rhabdochlamydiaceae bacterium]